MHESFAIFNVSMWFRCDGKFRKFVGSEHSHSCLLTPHLHLLFLSSPPVSTTHLFFFFPPPPPAWLALAGACRRNQGAGWLSLAPCPSPSLLLGNSRVYCVTIACWYDLLPNLLMARVARHVPGWLVCLFWSVFHASDGPFACFLLFLFLIVFFFKSVAITQVAGGICV